MDEEGRTAIEQKEPHVSDAVPNTEDEPVKDAAGAQTLIRGLLVLEVVATGKRALKDICTAMKLPKTSAYRLTMALVRNGYLRQVSPGNYALGHRLISLGFQAYAELDLITLAHPYLQELGRQTQQTVHLGILSGTQVFYLDKIPGPGQIQMASRIGGTLPAQNSGLGKALIASSPKEEWGKYFTPDNAVAPTSHHDLTAYLEDLEQIRERGYSLDLEEGEIGICCIGAAIRGAGEEVVGAISVSRAMNRDGVEVLEQMVPVVHKTAMQISRILGSSSAMDALKGDEMK
jgi:DNA-binding IclR family transcriptional regulator